MKKQEIKECKDCIESKYQLIDKKGKIVLAGCLQNYRECVDNRHSKFKSI